MDEAVNEHRSVETNEYYDALLTDSTEYYLKRVASKMKKNREMTSSGQIKELRNGLKTDTSRASQESNLRYLLKNQR